MPYFSFIMLCYNNWNFTKNAIDSFFKTLNSEHQNKGVELIIVNNGSIDETEVGIEEYKSRFKEVADIITINSRKNLGYINGVNAGLSQATGNIVTILNNDLIFCPHWFDGLASIFERDYTVGAAAPLMTNGSGEENILLEFKSPELKEQFYNSKETMNYYAENIMMKNRNVIITCNRIVGACVAIRKEALKLIGGLDFWFGIGIFDDDDLSLRVNIAGYKTVIVGGAFVYHIGSATFDKEKPVNRAAVISNKKKFLRKWKIKCVENNQGIYPSREDIIKLTPFRIRKHFFPLSLNQYRPFSKDIKDNNEVKKLLLAADWTNYLSKWLNKLESILQTDSNSEIHLWMPDTYFSKAEIEGQVKNSLKAYYSEQKDFSQLKYIDDDIDPIDLLAFISNFDGVLTVQNDFVNIYITDLAEKINIPVL